MLHRCTDNLDNTDAALVLVCYGHEIAGAGAGVGDGVGFSSCVGVGCWRRCPIRSHTRIRQHKEHEQDVLLQLHQLARPVRGAILTPRAWGVLTKAA